jgi:hypothetical protein
MKIFFKKALSDSFHIMIFIILAYPYLMEPLMKRCLYFAFIAMCLIGCKKKSGNTQDIDYSCDCSKYGKNIITMIIDHPLSLFPASNDRGNWGYMNSAGNMVINASFKDLNWFSHDLAVAWLESNSELKGGVISTDGTFAINAIFPQLGNYFSKEGLIRVGNSYQYWAYMNGNGGLITTYNYSEALDFYEGRAVVKYLNRYGAIDGNGTMVIPNNYTYLGIFSEGKAFAADFNGWLGYIGLNNDYIISPRYSATGIFVNGFAVVRDTVSPLFGFINSRGDYLVSPAFDDAGPFWEYLAAVKINNKWGFIDTLGNMAIQPQFDDILSGFCENLAGIEMGNLWGYADKTGNTVIQPQFKEIDVFYCGLAMVLFDDMHTG